MRTSKAMRRPVPLACSTTAAAILFMGSGVAGYTLSKHDRFVAGTPWSPSVIWWQVALGLVLLILAVWLWSRAIRSLQV